MNLDLLAKQALEAASKITEKRCDDKHTQVIAFKLACASMAKEYVDATLIRESQTQE